MGIMGNKMASVTDDILRSIGDREGLNTIRQRMYELDNPSQLETSINSSHHGRNSRRAGLIGNSALLLLLAACGGGTTVPTPNNAFTVTNQAPNGILPEGTTQAQFGVNTSREGMCRYDENNIPYASMTKNLDSAPAMQHMITLAGLSPGSIDRFVACVTPDNSQSINGYKITVQVARPSSVAFTYTLTPYDTNSPINGTFHVAGGGRNHEDLDFAILNNTVTVASDKGLQTGTFPGSYADATGFWHRDFTVTVNTNGLSVAHGNETENSITLFPTSFNLPDWKSWALIGSSGKIVNQKLAYKLNVGILDDGVYQNTNRKLTRVSDYTPNGKTIENLIDVLTNDLPVYNPLYSKGDTSYIKRRSLDPSVPNDSNTTNGWILIFPQSNPTFAIDQAQSGANGLGDLIIWASMGFTTAIEINRGGLTTDLRECLGYAQKNGEGMDSQFKPLPFFVKYGTLKQNWFTGPF